MFYFVVNFWNVHTGKIKNLIFFSPPQKKMYAQEEKKPFMPIFVMISQHYSFQT